MPLSPMDRPSFSREKKSRLENQLEQFFELNEGDWRRHYPGLTLTRLKQDLEVLKEASVEEFLQELKSGKPLEYITGQAHFFGRDFYVNPDVLIPRFETEILADEATKMINSINKTKVDVAEVGIGSGCIGLTILCDSRKPIHFIGGDISEGALGVSRNNFESFKNEFKFNHEVEYRKMDRLEGLEANSLDLIVSNPPYIKSEGDRSLVHAQVDQFEPSVALYINDEEYDQWFLSFFQQAINCLRPDGIFLMEGHEHHLKNQMNIINEFDSISHCEIIKDLNSEDRFLKFRKKNG